MEKIIVNPLSVRGLGDIVSPKILADFDVCDSVLATSTDTVNGVSMTVFTTSYRSGSRLLKSGDGFIVYTPFQITCGVYEVELQDANMASQNLANRAILSILKNWQTVQSEIMTARTIRNITLDTYTPMGYLDVRGKSDKVAMTGVILNVNHIVNWQLCCQQLLTNDNGE